MYAGVPSSYQVEDEKNVVIEGALTVLFGKKAYAAGACYKVNVKLNELANDVARFGTAEKAAKVGIATRYATKLAQELGVNLTDDIVDGIAEVVKYKRSEQQITETFSKYMTPDEIADVFTAVSNMAKKLPTEEAQKSINMDQVLKALITRNENGVRGAMHVIRDTEKMGIENVKSFEFQDATIFTNRKIDVLTTDNKIIEYKAWENGGVKWTGSIEGEAGKFFTKGGEARTEFIKDIYISKRDGKTIQWVVPDEEIAKQLKDRMLQELGAKPNIKGNQEVHPSIMKLIQEDEGFIDVIDDLIDAIKNDQVVRAPLY